MMQRLSQWSRARRLASDTRGMALIEFAFVLPVLFLLFIGGFQLMDAISAYRKVGGTVRALADLTTQNTTITSGQADQILSASQQIMTPYSPTNAVMRVSQIQVDLLGRGTISWSRSLNGTAYAKGAAFTLPSTLAVASPATRYFIYSEITYTYKPNAASNLIGTIPFTQTMFMSPRNSSFIVASDF